MAAERDAWDVPNTESLSLSLRFRYDPFQRLDARVVPLADPEVTSRTPDVRLTWNKRAGRGFVHRDVPSPRTIPHVDIAVDADRSKFQRSPQVRSSRSDRPTVLSRTRPGIYGMFKVFALFCASLMVRCEGLFCVSSGKRRPFAARRGWMILNMSIQRQMLARSGQASKMQTTQRLL